MTTREKIKQKYVLAILMAVLALGLIQCHSSSEKIAAAFAAKDVQSEPTAAVPPLSAWRIAIAQLAQENIPAVLHLDVAQRREIANHMLPFDNEPFFHFFFNGPQPPQKFRQELREFDRPHTIYGARLLECQSLRLGFFMS